MYEYDGKNNFFFGSTATNRNRKSPKNNVIKYTTQEYIYVEDCLYVYGTYSYILNIYNLYKDICTVHTNKTDRLTPTIMYINKFQFISKKKSMKKLLFLLLLLFALRRVIHRIMFFILIVR